MSNGDNGNTFRLECDLCRRLSFELKQCEYCLKFVCKYCIDEYSGLCIECTIALAKGMIPSEKPEKLEPGETPVRLELEELYEAPVLVCEFCGFYMGEKGLDEKVCPNCGRKLKYDEYDDYERGGSSDEYKCDEEWDEEDDSEEKEEEYEYEWDEEEW